MRRTVTTVAAVLLSFAVAAPAGAEREPEAKVTASTTADPGEYPGQVALLVPGVQDTFQAQFCGGTQIFEDWVLTAAHCVDDGSGAPPDRPDVLAGTTRLDGSGQRVAVSETFVHPQFAFPANDIALLHLVTPLSTPTARLAFPGLEVLEVAGTPAFVTGWGGLSGDEESQSFPVDLQEGETPVIADDVCQDRLAPHGDGLPPGAEPTMVCAGEGTADSNQAEADACRGDSGGPLWASSPDTNRRQIGIVSGGPTCGFSPTYYSSVISFIGFVETVTGRQLASFPDIVGNVLEPNIEGITVFGITTGNSSGLFDPAGQVSRGQMATFIARALGLDPIANGPFSDVDGSGTHDGNINAVADAGIAGGFDDGTYRPSLQVTRDQMATFLARALELAPLPSGPFADVTGGGAHDGNINAIAAEGIATVPSDNLYRPANPVTRAQMAAFLSRSFL